jgi:hypothetical protein
MPPIARTAATTLLLLLLIAAIATTASAQLTLYFDTPLASASGSVDAQARAGVAPDATVHVGGGVAASAATALRNPLMAVLGTAAGTEEAGRPQATTAAYVATPLSIASTLRPTVGFHFGEARGAAASGTAGGYLVGEFAYNPIANQLGGSVAGGSSGTGNVGSGDTLGGVVAGGDAAGLSGAESLGWADAQTTAGGGRGGQESQAIAYPTNLFSPLNPATCTQALAYGAARSNYGGDGSALPLIRGNEPSSSGDGEGDVSDGYGPAGGGAWGVPMCLALFDWGTLDDFVAFVEEDRPRRQGRSSSSSEHGGNNNDNNDQASFEDYVEHPGGAGKGEGNDGNSISTSSKGRREERAALRAVAAGGGGGGADSTPSTTTSPSFVASLAEAFAKGGPAAVDAFLQTTSLGKEMLRRAETAQARRQDAYDSGNRTSLRTTFGKVAATLAPAAADTGRAATALRNAAARNATNLAVQALVGVSESAEPALALQQRARAALVDPVRAASARLASSGLRRAAAGLERQQQRAGGAGGGYGGGMGQALGDAATALRASAAIAASDAADAMVASVEGGGGGGQRPQPQQQQQGGGGGAGAPSPSRPRRRRRQQRRARR